MLIKIPSNFYSTFRKLPSSFLIQTFKLLSVCKRFTTTNQPIPSTVLLSFRQNHNWKRHMEYSNRRRKVIPKLVYLHNPWIYLVTQFNLLRYQLFWDRNFSPSEFIRGAKQAAVVVTNTIRNQNIDGISKFTTPRGYKQITQDMLLSREDTRLKLVRFEVEHFRRTIPIKVVTKFNNGRKYCLIDVLFVGLRNTKDFETIEEILEIKSILNNLQADLNMTHEVSSISHRIVFAEIFIRFRRECTTNGGKDDQIESQGQANDKDWAVGFYKILSFDVFNYNQREK
ncbi:uncharacterized protein LOC106084659 [Stomoxys calcitrans]|uniref:uncharacterized protein LOC106084659 n=1 Tax=Stomoxys calcitrans TaxID=35570 RepID=UPI0027E2EB1E|nr:uncharacterized protein LOC106084659 [Stomoxys calcitrans]